MSRLQSAIDAWHKRKRRNRARPGEPAGVLFIASGGLGDHILMAQAMHRFSALAEDGEPITLILRKDASKTAFLFPATFEIMTVDYGKLRKDKTYRREVADDLYDRNFRLAVSLDYLRHPFLDEFLILAADARETVGMQAKPWPKYAAQMAGNANRFDRLFDSGPVLQDKMLRWMRFADWLGDGANTPPAFQTLASEMPADAGSSRPTVMIQAFSALKEKQCAPAVFEAAIGALPDDWDLVFTGAPGEDAANPEFADLLAHPRARYDDSTFEGLVPKLKAAKLAISVDTAFMHLAIAVGTPTLGLASAAYVGEIVPYAPELAPKNAHFIYHDMPCRGCLADCSLPKEDGRFPCIQRLQPDRVEAAVREMIDTLD